PSEDNGMERLPNFMERPDLLILYLFGLLIVVVLVLAALFAFAPRFATRQFVREILSNPVIQESIKNDQKIDVTELINQIMQRIEEQDPPSRTGMTGMLAKIIQDITWDMSGLI